MVAAGLQHGGSLPDDAATGTVRTGRNVGHSSDRTAYSVRWSFERSTTRPILSCLRPRSTSALYTRGVLAVESPLP